MDTGRVTPSEDPFEYRSAALFAEDVSLAELAERYATPLFVYSHTALVGRLRRLQAAFAGAPRTGTLVLFFATFLRAAKLNAAVDRGRAFSCLIEGTGSQKLRLVFGKLGRQLVQLRRAIAGG